MAKCPEADNCGYLRWRKERPDLHMRSLPENENCEIPPDLCQRLHPNIPLAVEKYGPLTEREITTVFPPILNTSNRSPRRLVGGGHGY